MATNAEDDDKSNNEEVVTEDDEESKDESVDTSEDTDNSDEEGQTDDETDKDDSQDEKPTFTKGEGFDWVKGDTPEEYARNLEKAYQNSTAEALKLKRKVEGKDTSDDKKSDDTVSPILRQAERRELEAMNKEYDSFLSDYPVANDPSNAEKLNRRVQAISKAIQEDEDREPAFAEVLSVAATSLGWKKDTSGKVAEAMKDAASSSTRSSSPKSAPKSKVTPAQIKAAKKFGWANGLSDAEIAKELEPHAA